MPDPRIGHLHTKVLAFVSKRLRLPLGRKALMGTNEHGMRIQEAAKMTMSYLGNSTTQFPTHLRSPHPRFPHHNPLLTLAAEANVSQDFSISLLCPAHADTIRCISYRRGTAVKFMLTSIRDGTTSRTRPSTHGTAKPSCGSKIGQEGADLHETVGVVECTAKQTTTSASQHLPHGS